MSHFHYPFPHPAVLIGCQSNVNVKAIKIQYHFQNPAVLVLAVQTVFPDKVDWTEISLGDRVSSRWSSPLSCTSFLCCALQQSLAKPPAEKSRGKKSKELKPRVKKLKYHQYIPPDQKQELNEVPMDSAYARLLQQQQQFLQLQILSQQKQQRQRYDYEASKLKYGSVKLCSTSLGLFLILITVTSANPIKVSHLVT